MRSARRLLPLRTFPSLLGLWLAWPAWVWPQSIIATLPVAGSPVAVNSVTHQVYVANSSGTVTVIDGPTESTTTLQVGGSPAAVAVNEVTNQIYVANAPNSSVTVIDGKTNALTTVSDPNATGPSLVAVNEATNKIYVVNSGSRNVTVIDGVSNSTTTVAEPSGNPGFGETIVGRWLNGIAINSVTNQIYIANSYLYSRDLRGIQHFGGIVTVIDGASNAVTSVGFGSSLTGIAVNPVTNKVFVTVSDLEFFVGPLLGAVAVIDAATNTVTFTQDPNDHYPTTAVAVNSTTNKIYVTSGGNVTVIDGATLSTTTVAAASPGTPQGAVVVDAATNTVYVTNGATGSCPGALCSPGSVTVIDGATNGTTTLIDPHASGPGALAIDASANRIYVANGFSDNLTVIAGDIAPTSHALAVIFSGASGGTVASSPAGIDCGVSSCAASFPVGAKVNLAASAAAPTVFVAWSDACSGSGSCQVTMNSDRFVSAIFGTPVPNVVGQTQAAASAAIASAGLSVGNVTQGSANGVVPGNVISESPAAGTGVAPGSAVNLVVSDDVAVPNVVGATQSAATSAITGAGLIMGTVTQQSSSTVASGDVIRESPAAGSYVGPGASVNLVLSTGGGGGGGGAFDWLTLGALLICLFPRSMRGRFRTGRP